RVRERPACAVHLDWATVCATTRHADRRVDARPLTRDAHARACGPCAARLSPAATPRRGLRTQRTPTSTAGHAQPWPRHVTLGRCLKGRASIGQGWHTWSRWCCPRRSEERREGN